MELVGAEFPNNIRVDPNQDRNHCGATWTSSSVYRMSGAVVSR